MISNTSSLHDVKSVLVETLGIEDRAYAITASTQLFGNLPELDSLAVVELAQALEDHFGLVIDDSEFTGETFETVGTLAEFVDRKRAEL
jgi:acyl carrier protein